MNRDFTLAIYRELLEAYGATGVNHKGHKEGTEDTEVNT